MLFMAIEPRRQAVDVFPGGKVSYWREGKRSKIQDQVRNRKNLEKQFCRIDFFYLIVILILNVTLHYIDRMSPNFFDTLNMI